MMNRSYQRSTLSRIGKGENMETIPEIKERIELAAKKLGLNAAAMMREYGVTSALADMLEREITKGGK